jgi:hypothetical protein
VTCPEIVILPPAGPDAPICKSYPPLFGAIVQSTETAPVPSGTVDGEFGFVVVPICKNVWLDPKVEQPLPPPTRAST